MDFSALFEQIGQFVATPYSVATFSVIVNIVLWRALQAESTAKDNLYERHVETVVEIIGDYHDFAHTLDEFVEVAKQAEEARARGDVDEGRSTA